MSQLRACVLALVCLFSISATHAEPAASASNKSEAEAVEVLWSVEPDEQCCKVCKKGKACGDTCIARDKECRVGPGCACDG